MKTYHGLVFLESNMVVDTVQCRFPRSKKKRIIKKWKLNDKNYKLVPSNKGYLINGDTMVLHPETVKRLELYSKPWTDK